jgi:hypothetical protein
MSPIMKPLKMTLAIKKWCLLAGCVFVAGQGMCDQDSGDGDEVIVIYNSSLPDSKAVADHYVELRHIPQNQVFGFNLTTNEDISRAEFRNVLQRPLAEKIEQKKLWHVAIRARHQQRLRQT